MDIDELYLRGSFARLKKIKCPLCGHLLSKKEETGLGVKFCENCESSWFILQTSRIPPLNYHTYTYEDFVSYIEDLQQKVET